MISVHCSSDKPDKTELACAEVLCVCVGGRDRNVPELKEVTSISPGNINVLGQELWAIYKERRKVAKMQSQTHIQEQSRYRRTERNVSGFRCIPVGLPGEPVTKEDQRAFSCSGFKCGNCLPTKSVAPAALPRVHSAYCGQSAHLRKLLAFLLLKTWVPVCPHIRLKLLLLAQCSPRASHLLLSPVTPIHSPPFEGHLTSLFSLVWVTQTHISLFFVLFSNFG